MQRDSSDLSLNLTGELGPLSLTTLRRSFPALPFEGEYTGIMEFNGPLSDLEVLADLNTSGGPLLATARFNAGRIADSYVLEAETGEGFVLSNLVPSFPEPTVLTGRVSAAGRGFSPNSLQGEATVSLRSGEVGALTVDSVVMEARIQDGILFVQQLVAETGVGRLEGSGSFGVASTAPPGELTIGLRIESLEPLRPFLMEEPGQILEDLTLTERDVLVELGAVLDTIPSAVDVAVDGSIQGEVVLRGGVGGFTGEGELDFQGLRLRTDFVESGSLTFSAEGFPGREGRFLAQIRTDSLNIQSLGYRTGSAEVDIGRSDGRVRATAVRSADEEYTAQGTYALDSLSGGIVNVDELTLRFDSVRWNLGGPASFAWTPQG